MFNLKSTLPDVAPFELFTTKAPPSPQPLPDTGRLNQPDHVQLSQFRQADLLRNMSDC
jgi:hypothetical protein